MMWRTRSEKISAPPPGIESTPASLQLHQHFANRDLGAPREVGDLHHGEGLDMHLRESAP